MSDNGTTTSDGRYFSAQAKRRHYSAGVALLAAAVALNFLVSLRLNQAMPKEGDSSVWIEQADGEAAVWWRDSLWFPAIHSKGVFELSPSDSSAHHLVRMTGDGPEEVCGLGPGRTWLMPREDGLWIFAADGVSRYMDEEIQRVEVQKPPVADGPPVLWEGKPAFATLDAGVVTVRTLEDKKWQDTAAFKIVADEQTPLDEVRMIVTGDKPLFLLRSERSIYSLEGIPAEPSRFPEDWREIGGTDGAWAALSDGGPAEVFTFKLDAERPVGVIRAHRIDAGEWVETEVQRVNAPPISMGAMAGDGARRLFYQSTPWTANLLTLEDGAVARSERAGRFYRLADPEVHLLLIGSAISFLLATMVVVAFWALTLRHRPPYYTLMGPPVVLASLARRALALAVDAVLLLGPFGVGMLLGLYALSRYEVAPPGMSALIAMPLALGGTIWAAIGAVVLTFLQARYGRTPGKWLLSIRVVNLELRPCGFGSSLLRNLLLILDMQLDFLVGIGLVSFTRHWQRAGDLLARTIVIRDMPQPTNLEYVQSKMKSP